jgi:hypothetical protein
MGSTGAIAISGGCGSARFGRAVSRRKTHLLLGLQNSITRRSKLKTAILALHFLAAFFVALSCDPIGARAAPIGTVTKVENQAQIGSSPAVVGSAVEANDRVRTGPKSRLEITFRDDTKLSLGENAEMVVDRFVYNPDQSTGELVLSTGAAAFRMATGKIGKMQNKNISVSTPFAALAVRGTNFWWGPTDGQYGALLVSHSHLEVHNDQCDKEKNEDDRKRCRCSILLDREGQGTDIRRRGACPGAPYQWPPGKVAGALASTSFGLALGPGLAPAAAGAAAAAAAAAASAANNNSNPPKVEDFTKPPDDNGGGGGGQNP